MDEKRDGEAPEGRRFTEKRRATFLAVLRATGNQRAAAEAIGMDRKSLDWRRKRDPRLDSEWKAAIAQSAERLGRAESQFEPAGDGDYQMIRRGPGGRPQIVSVAKGRWCRSVEDRFFEILTETGNAAAAARAVGFSWNHVAERRRKWPAFARRWEEALEEAEARLEFRLVCLGNNLPPGESGAAEGGASAERFDPEFALKFLKWREEKRAGRGRRGAEARRPTREEVKAEVLRRIEAIKRHRRKRSSDG